MVSSCFGAATGQGKGVGGASPPPKIFVSFSLTSDASRFNLTKLVRLKLCLGYSDHILAGALGAFVWRRYSDL